jgi:hypothetical protein
MAISASTTTKDRALACTLVAIGSTDTNLDVPKPRLQKAPKLLGTRINQTCAKAPSITRKQDWTPPWKQSATTIEQCKARFIRAVPLGGNAKCCQIDRSAILDLCNEALQKVHSPHHAQILSEVVKKALVILGSQKAQPNDRAFSTINSHLKPLDPRFAEPRLDYFADRKKRYKGDAFARRAAWRLRKWRAHGWPRVYPGPAIEEERQIDLKRAGPKKVLALDRDLYWGQEINP